MIKMAGKGKGWHGDSRGHALARKGINTSQAKGTVPKKIKNNKGYCVKCKQKVEIEKPKIITMKNKKSAIKGKCPNCDTKIFRIRGDS